MKPGAVWVIVKGNSIRPDRLPAVFGGGWGWACFGVMSDGYPTRASALWAAFRHAARSVWELLLSEEEI